MAYTSEEDQDFQYVTGSISKPKDFLESIISVPDTLVRIQTQR